MINKINKEDSIVASICPKCKGIGAWTKFKDWVCTSCGWTWDDPELLAKLINPLDRKSLTTDD